MTWPFHEIFWQQLKYQNKNSKVGSIYLRLRRASVVAWFFHWSTGRWLTKQNVKMPCYHARDINGCSWQRMLSEQNFAAICFFCQQQKSRRYFMRILWNILLYFDKFLYLFNIHDHNVKEKSCVGRNDFSSPPLTIGKVCRHYKMTLLFRANTKETLKQK